MHEYLKKLRAKNNLSQMSVVIRLNMSQQSYNLIENGHRQKNISINILQKLAVVFDVPVELLIAEETKLQLTAISAK